MVKIRHSQIKSIQNSTNLTNRILRTIHARLDTYLSACQLGITLTSLGLGWIGEPTAAFFLAPLLKLLNITNQPTLDAVSFLIAFILISFIHIVAGELLPKSLSIRYPWRISKLTGFPLFIFYYLTFPAIWLLNLCSNLLLKLVIKNHHLNEHEFYSTREIKHILHSSHVQGEITLEEAKIMEHTLDFADLRISEVMRPDDELVCLNLNDKIAEILPRILALKYTRYPLINQNTNLIDGLVHVKDIFINVNSHKTLGQIMRPILKIEATSSALEVLRKFRHGMPHLAVIYQNYELVGFVTLDNLLHVIIGKIKDEFNYTSDDWIWQAKNKLLLDGDCSIYSLEKAIGHDIPDNELGLANNVQELLTVRLGRMPKLNELVELAEFSALVQEITQGELKKILISIKLDKA